MSNMWGKILDPGCRSCLTEEGAEGRKLLLAEADKDEEMAELIKRLFTQPGGPSMKILRSCDFLFFIYFFYLQGILLCAAYFHILSNRI